jgi:O-antigen/teichoic acid export membrane protein
MKLNIKEYFRLSLIYTVIAALPSLLQTLAQPFIVGKGKLNAVDFSQLAITEIITSLVFVVTTFAMGNAISRFYYDYIEDKKGYNKLVSSVFNSIIIRGLFLLIVGITLSNYIGKFFTQKELQDFPSYGYASIILGINRAICLTAFALYRNEKKVKRFIIFNISLGILRTAFQLIGLFFYKMSFIGYLYGGCIGSGITTIAILGYTYYYSGIHLNFKILKSLNQFGRPLFLYGLIAWGSMYAGRFFLENSPKELGIYYAAITFALGIQLVLQGIQGATQPEVFHFMKLGVNEHQDEIKRLANLMMLQTQALIAVIIIPTMLYLTLFYKSDVKAASTFIGIIFIDYILKSQSVVFSYPIYYLKKTKFLFIINSIALIINLLLSSLLAPVLKANGLIAATIIQDIILTLGIFYYQNRIIYIKWNINKVLIYPFIIVLIAIAIEIIKNIMHINQYISSIFIVIVMFSGMSLLYKKEIRGMILKYINKPSII